MRITVDSDNRSLQPVSGDRPLSVSEHSDRQVDLTSKTQGLGKVPIPNQNKCGGYYIDIGKEETVSNISLSISMYANLVLLIGSSVLGHGDDQQGSTLMNSFLYAITRLESVPSTIIFINSGVFLVSEGSPVLEHLKILESRGVEIVSSASCLEYYDLQDKLRVGYFSNMFSITEKMFAAAKLIAI
ncbi:hypothetical protein ASZ90_017482 [hydrocarbon metagenome]|uniref:Uncharacterized protein n=1 Tax=hydrocarbon metagenome TaxID=938273 RepID=A0A0W8E8X9_9ZZZZ